MVETTPVVFRGRLYRFEYVRHPYYKPNMTGASYFRFVEMARSAPTPAFARGYHLGVAHAQGDTMYVYGVPAWGGRTVQVFWSKDLERWNERVALTTPRWGLYNSSVCEGRGGMYVMAVEVGEPPEEVGVRFTIRFALSPDLLDWQLTPSDHVYSREKYTACPALRFVDPWYYMIYLEAYPGPEYEPHIVRSADLVRWEPSRFNPIMRHSDEDKRIANPAIAEAARQRIRGIVNVNNSDVDLCEWQGKTVIFFSWGTQQGDEFLAQAEYDGPLQELLEAYF
jgi:hypothetical protein